MADDFNPDRSQVLSGAVERGDIPGVVAMAASADGPLIY